jgi:archaellum component FlaF (FlaF/FlaG flagellin family)
VNNSAEPSPETSGAAEQSTSVEADPGKLLNNGTTYVDASNWQAILDDVCQSLRVPGPSLTICVNSSKKSRSMYKMMTRISTMIVFWEMTPRTK